MNDLQLGDEEIAKWPNKSQVHEDYLLHNRVRKSHNVKRVVRSCSGFIVRKDKHYPAIIDKDITYYSGYICLANYAELSPRAGMLIVIWSAANKRLTKRSQRLR